MFSRAGVSDILDSVFRKNSNIKRVVVLVSLLVLCLSIIAGQAATLLIALFAIGFSLLLWKFEMLISRDAL